MSRARRPVLVPSSAAVAALAFCVTGCADDAAAEDSQGTSPDAAAFVACPDSIPELEPGLTAEGDDDRLHAVLLDASRMPARKYRNEWTLELTGDDGEPLGDAQVTAIETFMPVHGHFGRPAATAEALAPPGQVGAEVHFTMRGPWEVRLQASSASAGDDRIVFHVCVEE